MPSASSRAAGVLSDPRKLRRSATGLVVFLAGMAGEAVRWCFVMGRALLSRRAVVESGGFATVTLTTYRPRMWAAMLAVDSLSRGRVRPARVILFVGGPGYDRRRLPWPLALLARRGVRVVVLEQDLGTYTKLPLSVWDPEPDTTAVITVDDDVLYPSDWLWAFRDAAARDGENILCYGARRITFDGGRLAPYVEWPEVAGTEPRMDLLPLGVMGVLYRRPAFEAIRRKGLGFRELAPNADDLWFRFCTIECGIAARRIVNDLVVFPIVPFTEGNARWHANVTGGGNDAKAARIAPLFDLSRITAPARTAG